MEHFASEEETTNVISNRIFLQVWINLKLLIILVIGILTPGNFNALLDTLF
jgi:hypothetical protein